MLFGVGSGELMQVGGMFALVAFMICQNYRQGQRMAKALDQKDEDLKAANARAERLAVNFTDAIVGITAVMKDRPCLAEDPRVEIGKVRT